MRASLALVVGVKGLVGRGIQNTRLGTIQTYTDRYTDNTAYTVQLEIRSYTAARQLYTAYKLSRRPVGPQLAFFSESYFWCNLA